MTEDLLELLDRVVAQAHPDEAVEAFGVDETETTVRAYGGQVETLSSARTRGMGIRVITEGRMGYAYTADLTEGALAETLEAARTNATVATSEDANRLPEPPVGGVLPDIPALYDDAFAEVRPETKVELALRLEAAVRSAGGAIRGVDTAQYGDGERTAAIASTTGVRGASRRCDAFCLVEALAEADGATASAYGLSLGRLPHEVDVEAAAAEAVGRVTRLLGGRKPPSGAIPVIMDPFAAVSFLGVLAGALTAEAVQKGRSLFAGRVGEELGGAHLSLVDDGSLIDGPAAAPWDGEGVPTGPTTLIERGVLRGYLHNTYTAAKDGTVSTGNASRSGYKSPPGLSPSNLYLAPGSITPAGLFAQAGTAFYCQNVLGVHSGANPISGDFSVGANGLMIRDGALAEPVREATIAGTIPTMLTGLVAVGSDLRWLPFEGGVGASTLLLEGMTLGGS
ncbi:MAG: TldD/PmbA family protein [Nitriliruptorales bacterium]|nr:TldD/PmbA family protein [Nitriliruptorales bacterium]